VGVALHTSTRALAKAKQGAYDRRVSHHASAAHSLNVWNG
jgi:hypothetical protein